jgi:hypothetical protein
MRIRVSVQTLSPISISRGRAIGNELQTAGRIPGGTWRGALAAYIMEERGLDDAPPADGSDAASGPENDADFHRLFLAGEARFSDLRWAGGYPWPLSARGCALDDGHPVVDLLADTSLKHKLLVECKDCGAKVALPRKDYYERDRYGQPRPAGPTRRITAHTAISGRTLRVMEQQFFSTEILERQQPFEGEVRCTEEAGKTLQAIIGEGVRLTIGRAGTRGCGDVLLNSSEVDDSGDEGELKRRLERLNALFQDRGEVAFTCTLVSPALVLDEWLMARSWIAAADIAEAAGEPASLDGYDLAACYCRTMVLAGWNAQAKLPKSDAWAIAPGSAFLFKKKHQGDARVEIDRLARILAKAQTGIGERWEEGLGEAVFCDEFHIQQRLSCTAL